MIKYKLSDKSFMETKLCGIIEVPFERNESIESITFQLKTLMGEEEITC